MAKNTKYKMPEYPARSIGPKIVSDANDGPGLNPDPELQGATFTGAKGLLRPNHEKKQG